MFEEAEVLQIFVTAADRHGDRSLCEAIVEACHAHGLAGVTVMRNVEGFDETATIAREHWLHHDDSIALIVVDTSDRIARLAELVTPWLGHGIITRSDARARRVERAPDSTAGA